MKKPVLLVLTMVLFWAFVLVGCASVVQETYPEFMVTENEELSVVELNHDGLIYRPYGVIPDSRAEEIKLVSARMTRRANSVR